MDEKDSRISRINEYLKSSSCQIYLEEYYEENGISELECIFYNDRVKLSYDFDDVTVFEPELVAINPSSFNDFYIHNTNYLGDNKLSISFQFESEVDFNFSCADDDFEELPYKVRKLFSISRSNEVKIIHAKGKLDAQYRGVITISNVNEELTVKELDVHFSYLGADQCSILCYLDIESVEVKEI